MSTIDPITREPISDEMQRVLAKIDARISLYNGAIDKRIAALTDGSIRNAANIAPIAAELARYGTVKAELELLKEIL